MNGNAGITCLQWENKDCSDLDVQNNSSSPYGQSVNLSHTLRVVTHNIDWRHLNCPGQDCLSEHPVSSVPSGQSHTMLQTCFHGMQ